MSVVFWNRKFVWMILIASLAFNAGVGVTFGVRTYRKHVASRWWGDHKPPEDCKHGRSDFLRDLGLSAGQEELMQAARAEMFEDLHGLRSELSQKRQALTDLMTVAEPDMEGIAAQLNEIALLRERMDQRVVNHFLYMRQQLEPDQLEVMDEMIRRTFSRGGPGFSRHGGPRDQHRGPWSEKREPARDSQE